ncbi:MATE family efflux transporter [Portibacter lacus]|uniref:MATE family efflux transporter n=2 Tax=Portibacter lacus TaxID=1099794 RepID=A0AA37SMB7_9BACT|nr:MATE family efflux transporter [Portibacter lacus]
MLGSAVQNIIALTDSVFLFHYNDIDFRAIGLVSVFYLIISAIGYGFSRGGQIIIARRFGEGDNRNLVRSFYALLYFELALAFIIFIAIQFGGAWFFKQIVSDLETFDRCVKYLLPRSYGIFFSYLGVIIVALYTGIGKTRFIVVDVAILAIVNMILNYAFIFGKWGFAEMGIAGAGWASSIAEFIAFVVFLIYMIFEKNKLVRGLFFFPKLNFKLVLQVFNVSIPIVIQAIIGLGSWFVFFSLIENMGGKELEISNLVRIVYLILSIPTWGFSSGINTLASNLRGSGNEGDVIPVIWKTVYINLLITVIISIPIIFFPETMLYPLFGREDMTIIYASQPLLYVLGLILLLFAVGAILFNGILGIGATKLGLWIQGSLTIFYTAYVFIFVKYFQSDLTVAWFSEVFYWFLTLVISAWFLYKYNWEKIKI